MKLKLLINCTFYLMLGGLMLMVFWLVYPYKTLVFNDQEFKIIDNIVRRGEYLQYTSDYCKFTDEYATISRYFVNDLIFQSNSTITKREQGCKTVMIAIQVPRELPPGVYYLKNFYTYKVNPIREVTVSHNTEKFTVIE